MSRADLRSQAEDYGAEVPYHEDLVVLPTRPNLRIDTKSISRDAKMSFGPQPGRDYSEVGSSIVDKHIVREACMALLQDLCGCKARRNQLTQGVYRGCAT